MWTQKLAIIVSVAAFTAACGEAPELDSAQDSADMSIEETNDIYVPDDVSCSKSDLNGYYRADLMKRSGDCPALDSFIIKMTDGQMTWGGPCDSDSTAFSHQECKQDGRVVCGDSEMVLTVDSQLAQLEETGSILTGSMVINIAIIDDENANCESEYQTKLERLNQ
jgi:hypothetical protein